MKGYATTPSKFCTAVIVIIALSFYGLVNGVDPYILD